MPEEQLVLLHIEQQAMVQVIIKEVANHLDFRDNSKINTVSYIVGVHLLILSLPCLLFSLLSAYFFSSFPLSPPSLPPSSLPPSLPSSSTLS